MADLITFEMTLNGGAVYMKTGDLIHTTIDYKSVDIQKNLVEQIIVEENSDDGVNIILASGTKHTVDPNFVTKVGAVAGTIEKNYGLPNDPYFVFSNNQLLRDELVKLVGW